MSDDHWKVGISDDYAVMRGGGLEFYYGWEETDDDDEWLFIVSDGSKHLMSQTAVQMGIDPCDDPERILLEGVARWLDASTSHDREDK